MAAGWARTLAWASVAFAAANVAHGIDHQRQGTERLTTEVTVGGTALTLAAFLTLFLVLRRHRWAPAIATATGAWAAMGVTAAHVAPHWSAFSDPYPDLSLGVGSWIVMLVEIAAGAALALAGARALRATRWERGAALRA
jgi:hypothetical protein